MKIKYIPFLVSVVLLGATTSCSDWLDVDMDTEKKVDNMFDNYSGFQGALAGCYADLCKTDLYGERLTMSNIESMAGLWYANADNVSSGNVQKENYFLSAHDYNDATASGAIKAIYGGLFNTILEVNNVLKGCREKGDNIPYADSRTVIEGEAYALRAFCHLDVLRMFGQMPNNPVKKVSLPYSETTSLEEMPAYYSYEDFVQKLEGDFNMALSLLKDNDPAYADYSYDQLAVSGNNSEIVLPQDEFMMYRRHRMNYWAVKALQARMYMYVGETEKAYQTAMEVINAKLADGKKVVELSSDTDYGTTGNSFISPSECLFSLSINALYDRSVALLAGGETEKGSSFFTQCDPKENLLLDSKTTFQDLFAGVNQASDIRFKRMWSMTATSQNFVYPSIRKYYIYKNSASSTGDGLIPIIRLSEMYLIAMETAKTLEEASNLYSTYMVSKGVAVHEEFASHEDLMKKLEQEFRIEFFAEGQMFYYYKRHNTTTLWSKSATMSETEYIVPLPNTEFNPNK